MEYETVVIFWATEEIAFRVISKGPARGNRERRKRLESVDRLRCLIGHCMGTNIKIWIWRKAIGRVLEWLLTLILQQVFTRHALTR